MGEIASNLRVIENSGKKSTNFFWKLVPMVIIPAQPYKTLCGGIQTNLSWGR